MTREATHPGETLREDLEALRTAGKLARQIEVPVNRVTQIVFLSTTAYPGSGTPRPI